MPPSAGAHALVGRAEWIAFLKRRRDARGPGETTDMPSGPAAECALVTAEMLSGSPRWFERSKQLVQRPRAARSIFGERLFGELGERVRRAFEQFVPTSLGR